MDHDAAPLRQTRPTLTLFCGLPGSGKSTLARRLETEGRGVRVSTDEWQADLAVGHDRTDFHERLQVVLYRHALDLLRHGVDVILEDGLWLRQERTAKFADARSCSARIALHVFNVDYDILWKRLQLRTDQASPADYPMTEAELRWAAGIFQAPSVEELDEVDSYELHAGGLA